MRSRIRSYADFAAQVTDGDLTERLDADGSAELAALGTSLNHMVEGLAKISSHADRGRGVEPKPLESHAFIDVFRLEVEQFCDIGSEPVDNPLFYALDRHAARVIGLDLRNLMINRHRLLPSSVTH